MVKDVTAGDVPFIDRELILRIMKLHDTELRERLRALVALGPFSDGELRRDIEILEVVSGLTESVTLPNPFSDTSRSQTIKIYRMRQEEFEDSEVIQDERLRRKTRSWIYSPLSDGCWIVLERPHGYVLSILNVIDKKVRENIGSASFTELLGVHR